MMIQKLSALRLISSLQCAERKKLKKLRDEFVKYN